MSRAAQIVDAVPRHIDVIHAAALGSIDEKRGAVCAAECADIGNRQTCTADIGDMTGTDECRIPCQARTDPRQDLRRRQHTVTRSEHGINIHRHTHCLLQICKRTDHGVVLAFRNEHPFSGKCDAVQDRIDSVGRVRIKQHLLGKRQSEKRCRTFSGTVNNGGSSH